MTLLRLRHTCSAWLKASATPGLANGLDVLLDDWARESTPWPDVEQKAALWLALIHPVRPYHLILRSNRASESQNRDELARFLLAATPSPTYISIVGDSVLPAILDSTSTHDRLDYLAVSMDAAIDDDDNFRFIEDIFPNLNTFIVNAPFELQYTLKHSNLECLVLNNLIAHPEHFQCVLQDLPSLVELKLDSTNKNYSNVSVWPMQVYEPKPVTVSSIQVLTIVGEDLSIEILDHLTLPSLKFLGIKSNGRSWTWQSSLPSYPDFFLRSGLNSKSTTISIIGGPDEYFFADLMESLPPSTVLHCNIEPLGSVEHQIVLKPGQVKVIFCPNLKWLEELLELTRRGDGDPVKIFIPDVQVEPAVMPRIQQLGDLGYIVETCPTKEMEKRLKYNVHWMTVPWGFWERCTAPLCSNELGPGGL